MQKSATAAFPIILLERTAVFIMFYSLSCFANLCTACEHTALFIVTWYSKEMGRDKIS